MSEQFCLKWNDFQLNVAKSFSKLRNEDDFYDVTLVSDDKQQVSAHKLVLSSCSDYFKTILKQNNHSHPLLCLEGISSSELNNVLDYIYNGEVQICQEDLERFLQIASRFQLEGLIGGEENSDEVKEEIPKHIDIPGIPKLMPTVSPKLNQKNVNKSEYPKIMSLNSSDVTNSYDIDRKIEELTEKDGSQFRCKPCGKISSRKFHAYEHAETHMEGLSYSCQLCDKTFRTKNAKRIHGKQHSNTIENRR